MDDRDGFGHSGGFRVHGGEHVCVVFTGQRRDELDPRKVGLVKYVRVGDVSVEHAHPIEAFGYVTSAVGVTFDHLHSSAGLRQLLGDDGRRPPTPEQKNLTGNIAGQTQ